MKKTFLAALCATTLAACGSDDHSDDHDDHQEEDHHAALAADACAHMKEAPVHVQASADPALAASAVSATHQPFVIELPEVDGGHRGAVLFTPEESGPFAFFTGTEVDLTVYDGEVPLPFEESESIGACPGLLAMMETVDLRFGTQYTLVFGPTTEAEIRLITLHADDEHAGHGH